MAVSTGSATSNIDLLQQLVAWLVTRGWTSSMSQASGAGWRAHLSKGSVYANFLASRDNDAAWASNVANTLNFALHLYLGTGYNSGAAFNAQAGGPVGSGTSNTVGICAVTGSGAITSYQFLDDGADNIVVVIERTPGVFRYLAWGTITKFGSWTGGEFFCGSSPGYYASTFFEPGAYSSACPFATGGGISTSGHNAFLRADVDAFTGKWLSCGSSATVVFGYTGKYGSSGIKGDNDSPPEDVPNLSLAAQLKLHNTLDGRVITLPITLYGNRDGGGYSALGEVPSLRLCRASEIGGASVGSDLPIGSDTWRVFPGFLVKVV